MLVEDIMSRKIGTCLASTTAREAVVIMQELDCGAIPVTDAEGNLSGIVTDRDILLTASANQLPLTQFSVEAAMTPRPSSCRAEDSIHVVEHLMSRLQVRRVPVVDERGHPCGIVSLSDLARYQSAGPTSAPQPESHVVAKTLQSIVSPTVTPQAVGDVEGVAYAEA